MDPIPNWELVRYIEYFGPKIILALFCGGLVGFERELKSKAAGIKTNMLICMGATLFSSLSVLVSQDTSGNYHSDPARLAAQIVSGIGFLGAGAILQSHGGIVGLTTAATIWVVAAIGTCIGFGLGLVAIVVSFFVVAVLLGISYFEGQFLERPMNFECYLVAEDRDGSLREQLHKKFDRHDLRLEEYDMKLENDHSILQLKLRGSRQNYKRLLLDLWSMQGVREVQQR